MSDRRDLAILSLQKKLAARDAELAQARATIAGLREAMSSIAKCGHAAAAVKAIAEWIRNPHEDAENNWTPSWVADAIERGEPFRPRAGK